MSDATAAPASQPPLRVRGLLLGAGALAVLWLGLRVLLLWSGGQIGESVRFRFGQSEVAAIMVAGKGAGGERLLLIAAHGGLATKETLLGLCWEAAQRGADCVTVDALGHGDSSPLPTRNTIATMRRALHVEQELGVGSERVYFIGHSMGAYLGCGAVFPCEHSVSIGQPVACEDDRIIRSNLHHQLGLPASFYLPISHVLEPWTPAVIEGAIERVLPLRKDSGQREAARARIGTRVALAWSSLLALAAAGVLLARGVRAQRRLPPALRGMLGAVAVFGALMVASWRTIWWLVPLQRTDLLILAPLVGTAFAISSIGRQLGLRQPRSGVLLGAMLTEGAAVCCFVAFPVASLRGLLILPLALLIPVALVVGLCERLSRSQGDSVEAALFTTLMLGTFLSLLVPGL